MQTLLINDVARVCHEANRAYCAAIGDHSQKSWDEAPEWQRESAVQGVRAVASNPNHTPRNSHESWLSSKVAAGWVYGPVKDENRKVHPCCAPYDELPAFQKLKDDLFVAVARALLKT